jgi:hypothetical protein
VRSLNSKCELSTNICNDRHVQTCRSHKENEGGSQGKRSGERKDFSSLKRNLFTEFNSISNADENVKKETVEENTISQNALNESKSLSIAKEELKSNILGCMSPMQESLKYNVSVSNSLTPTPLKGNAYYDGKDLVPPYPNFKDNYQKCTNLNNYPPFLSAIKDKFSPSPSGIIDVHNIQEEICGKKRLRYESCYSDNSPHSTPNVYQHYEQDRDLRYVYNCIYLIFRSGLCRFTGFKQVHF